MILDEWLKTIHNKLLLSIELPFLKLNIKNNYIIIFDIEFLKFKINFKQMRSIHEMGGILLNKENDIWFLKCIFHINLPPLETNIDNLYLLTSTYNTLSPDNDMKVQRLENKLLVYNQIIDNNNLSDDDIYLLIKKDKISNIYFKKYINNFKKFNMSVILKYLNKVKHIIYGNDIKKFPIQYKLFTKINNIILNDPLVIKRTISDHKLFLKLTNELFIESYLIVKGIEDLKALKYHSMMLNIKFYDHTNFTYFDIAQYNNVLFKKCDSAELEKSYLCLEKNNLTQKYNQYFNIIKNFTNNKAHNPLTDAYYTWIIFNIYNMDNI
jgi:hypothetical protein